MSYLHNLADLYILLSLDKLRKTAVTGIQTARKQREANADRIAEFGLSDELTVRDMAALLNVNPVTIYNWVRRDRLPLPKKTSLKGRGYLAYVFRKTDVLAWIEQQNGKT